MSEKLNPSIIRILQSIAPQLVVSFLVGCVGVVTALAVVRIQLDDLTRRVSAIEIQHQQINTTLQKMSNEVYWLYRIHGGTGE